MNKGCGCTLIRLDAMRLYCHATSRKNAAGVTASTGVITATLNGGTSHAFFPMLRASKALIVAEYVQ